MNQKDHIHVLVAPNSMKGSLDAFEFARVVEEAFIRVSSRFEVRKVPVADGGDFTGEVLRRALHAVTVDAEVDDPLGRPVRSRYAIAGKTAVIEMADASGIRLLKQGEPDPLIASSFGTGQLLALAIHRGCTEILLGIGGSATIDGGTGMLTALGYQLADRDGKLLAGNGANLERIARIIPPANRHQAVVKIISDVSNPLSGPSGAVAVFGAQKGATPESAAVLEHGLAHWCGLLEKESGKRLASLKGAGAAGGMALPLVAFFDAEIVPGAAFILQQLGVEQHIRWADVVITGEGKIDSQTLHNKAPFVVADMAAKAGKPVIAIGGSVEKEASAPFNGMFSILQKPLTLEASMKNSREMLDRFSTELARLMDAIIKK
jgi:glycerate 2-kinase